MAAFGSNNSPRIETRNVNLVEFGDHRPLVTPSHPEGEAVKQKIDGNQVKSPTLFLFVDLWRLTLWLF